ncbi:MAG: phosphatase PAP2 family protein [Ignavibacteriae bacterium]|nr:phosphatase PAP2 family protein [Ignavibacteriota bacterium]
MDNIRKNSFFRFSCIISFAILVIIAFLLPEGFTEFRNTDKMAPFWYMVTQSGGIYGASSIIIFLFIFLMSHFRKKPNSGKNIFVFMLTVILVQGAISLSTLFIFKELFREPRPSQLYFIEKGVIENRGKEFYAMPMEEKSLYLRERVDEDKNNFLDVYPPILDSWIYETGFSFPSGHSQTGFFLGTILAFVLYKTNPKKYYFFFPLIWAVLLSLSRVLIGVHYPLDVTAGAFMSLIIALYIVSLKKFNIIFE